MRIGAFRLRRAGLAALGLAAACATAGCQTCGSHFCRPGVARGEMVPTSPAFARVAAGQQLARAGTTMTVTPPVATESVVIGQPTPVYASPPTVVGQPIAGSGGIVYPVNYAPAPGAPMMPTASMASHHPMAMPVQQQMVPTVAPHPASGGQQTLLLVNGPNGPQYMIAEVIGQVQAQPAAPVMTMPVANPHAMTVPTAAPPMVMPASAPEISAPAPMSVPSPGAPAAAPVAAPVSSPPAPAPALVAPPPASIPMPMVPPVPPPPDTKSKAPAPLPEAVNLKQAGGPVLPAPEPATPTLASYPVPAVASEAKGPKLPAASEAADDIPAAPVFVPAPR